jgi:hypothetical protein
MSEHEIRLMPEKIEFRKSTYSNGPAGCVEVAQLGVAVRDSKNPGGPVLHFTLEEWEPFEQGVREGQFEVRPKGTAG